MRKTLRETMLENHAALCQMAALAGKPRPPLPVSLPAAPVKRVSKPRTEDSIPLEKELQKSIIVFLLAHPSVALVVRHNSGALDQTTINGKHYPIFFHRVYKKGLRLVDLDVLLKNGVRLLIEVKRENWNGKPKDLREQEQKAYLEYMTAHGAVGFFATSIDEVEEVLKRVG